MVAFGDYRGQDHLAANQVCRNNTVSAVSAHGAPQTTANRQNNIVLGEFHVCSKGQASRIVCLERLQVSGRQLVETLTVTRRLRRAEGCGVDRWSVAKHACYQQNEAPLHHQRPPLLGRRRSAIAFSAKPTTMMTYAPIS